MQPLTSAVLRRRKRGRELEAKLQRVSEYLASQHCGYIPDAWSQAYGFPGLPAWDSPTELYAARVVSEMKLVVRTHESFARTMDQKRFEITDKGQWGGAPMPGHREVI